MNSKKEIAINVIQSIETGDQSAFTAINPNKYIQHNLSMTDGVEGIINVLDSVPQGVLKAKCIRAFEDGEYAIVHTEYDFFGPITGFDVFRFENNLIVEHWDNIQNKWDPNKSGRTMTDGTTEINDLDKTDENKKTAETLIKEVFIGGAGNTIGNYMDPNFLQHNPHGADGMQGMGVLMEYYNGSGNILRYDRLHKVLGQGNFVLTIGEGLYGLNGGVPTTFYDLFRFENGKVVEHWDVMEAQLEASKQKNSNGKFNFPQ